MVNQSHIWEDPKTELCGECQDMVPERAMTKSGICVTCVQFASIRDRLDAWEAKFDEIYGKTNRENGEQE